MRVLYTNLRVGDLKRSIAFYQDVLGMKLRRRAENKKYKYSLVWLGFTDDESQAGVELTYNWDTSSYDLGTGFGQIVIAVADVYAAADKVKQNGGTFTREPGPVKGGNTVIAFLEDPDGYRIEYIEEPSVDKPF